MLADGLLGLVALALSLVLAALVMLSRGSERSVLVREGLRLANQQLAGKLDVARAQVFSDGRLVIEGVRLLDPDGLLVAEVARLSARVDLPSLLRQRVSLSDTEIRGLRLLLQTDPAGQLNLMRALAPAHPGPAAAPSRSPSGPSWTVAINDAVLGLDELSFGQEGDRSGDLVQLRGAELRARFDLDALGGLTLSAAIGGGGVAVPFAAPFAAQLRLAIGGNQLRSSAEITVEDSRLAAEADIDLLQLNGALSVRQLWVGPQLARHFLAGLDPLGLQAHVQAELHAGEITVRSADISPLPPQGPPPPPDRAVPALADGAEPSAKPSGQPSLHRSAAAPSKPGAGPDSEPNGEPSAEPSAKPTTVSQGEAPAVALTGRYGLAGADGKVKVELRHLDLNRFLRSLPTSDINVVSKGNFRQALAAARAGRFEVSVGPSRYAGVDIGPGHFLGERSGALLRISDLDLAVPGARVAGRGELIGRLLQAQVEVKAPALGVLREALERTLKINLPDFDGNLTATVSVEGPLSGLSATADVSSSSLLLNGLSATGFSGQVRAPLLGRSLDLHTAASLRTLEVGGQTLRDLALVVDWHSPDIKLTTQLRIGDQPVVVSTRLAVAADLLTADLAELQLTFPRAQWSLLGPTRADFRRGVTVQGLGLGSGEQRATLDIATQGPRLETLATLERFDLGVLPAALLGNHPATGALSGSFHLVTEGKRREIEGDLRIADGSYGPTAIPAGHLTGKLDESQLSVVLEAKVGSGTIDGHFEGPLPAKAGPLDGVFKLHHVTLADLTPFYPDLAGYGATSELHLQLDGTWAAPRLELLALFADAVGPWTDSETDSGTKLGPLAGTLKLAVGDASTRLSLAVREQPTLPLGLASGALKGLAGPGRQLLNLTAQTRLGGKQLAGLERQPAKLRAALLGAEIVAKLSTERLPLAPLDRVPALAAAHLPVLRGSATASGSFDGTVNAPRGDLDLSLRDLAIDERRVGSVDLRAAAHDEGVSLHLAVATPPATHGGEPAGYYDPASDPASGRLQSSVHWALPLEAIADPARRRAAALWASISGDRIAMPVLLGGRPTLSGLLAIEGGVRGTLLAPKATLDLDVDALTVAARQLGILSAHAGWDGQRLGLSLAGEQPAPSASPSTAGAGIAGVATAPLAAAKGPAAPDAGVTPEPAAEAAPAHRSGPSPAALKAGATAVSTASAAGGRPTLGAAPRTPGHAPRRGVLSGPVDPRGGSLQGKLQLPLTEGGLGQGAIDGQLKLTHFDLGALEATLVERDLVRALSGIVDADLAVGGTPQAPLPQGQLQLRGGRLALAGLGEFERLELAAALTPDGLTVSRLACTSGQGPLEGQLAVVRRRDDPSGVKGRSFEVTGQLSAQRFGVYASDQLRALLSSQVALGGQINPSEADLTVTMSKASVSLPSLLQKSLGPAALDSDIRFGPLTTAAATTGAPGYKFLLHLMAPGPIPIDGPDVSLIAQADLWIQQQGELGLRGLAQVTSGQVTAYSHTFDIDRANVQWGDDQAFAGPLDAHLDAQASQQIEDYKVAIVVAGRLTAPLPELSSDPPLSSDRIAQLLLTGSAESDSSGDQNSGGSNGALSLVGDVLAAQIKGALGPAMPLDVLTLEPNRAEAGKRITPQLYVGGIVNSSVDPRVNGAELHARYDLTRRWALDARYGSAQAGAFDLVWRYSW